MSVFFLWTPLRNLMKEAKEEEARQGMEMHDMDEDEENDIHNNEIIGEKSTDEIEQSDSNTNYSLNEKNETKFTDNITKADEKV
ncbi:hypothetical protein TRFO_13580 [Tritrichomonas foetus]|uniref:Uncharacterized protein n=1 Tax=Tritrichomonas foetus TaxID=1144522 RepID=A0A1J4L1V2_9EUKA|nr:hypothetical protein TRFO_13580 [Tritrichomonas foetus]|eukprot:OHT15926.1 hypothetical protein TRFO_13580 [Tritrichomonas foetus]